MKNKNYREKAFRKMIEKKRKENKGKAVYLRLNKEQLCWLRKMGIKKITPSIYEVKTREFYNVKRLPQILKFIHYEWKRGKKIINIKLKETEEEILTEYDVEHYLLKTKVDL